VTFTVSDGVRSDSESVAIFVLPALALHGQPADRAAHLSWTYGGTLPVTSTWRISYYSQTMASTIVATDMLTNSARAYTLTGLTNYTWYTITLDALVDTAPIISDTARVMPTNIILHLPLVSRGD
jgi:hypothetical protein